MFFISGVIAAAATMLEETEGRVEREDGVGIGGGITGIIGIREEGYIGDAAEGIVASGGR